MFVSDLTHFLDLPDDAGGPVRKMADHLIGIVRAGTAGGTGGWWVSALPCQRRPARQVCPGTVAVSRTDIPAHICWECTACGDEGVVTDWADSVYDLRPDGVDVDDDGELVGVVVSADVAGTLRGLMLIDRLVERLVFRATVTGDGIVIVGTDERLEELVEAVAAEANHEPDGRRRKRLDTAFTGLNTALVERDSIAREPGV